MPVRDVIGIHYFGTFIATRYQGNVIGTLQ